MNPSNCSFFTDCSIHCTTRIAIIYHIIPNPNPPQIVKHARFKIPKNRLVLSSLRRSPKYHLRAEANASPLQTLQIIPTPLAGGAGLQCRESVSRSQARKMFIGMTYSTSRTTSPPTPTTLSVLRHRTASAASTAGSSGCRCGRGSGSGGCRGGSESRAAAGWVGGDGSGVAAGAGGVERLC
jgi:hypothetical protein